MEARAYRIEAETKAELVADVAAITDRACDDGQGFRVKISKDGDWWIAVVEVFK
jgi:hypothetical protein